MHLQAALCQPCLKLRLESLSFLLVPAVDQPIVCIPTPRKVWMRPCHPEIKRVMQEQVCQYRADNAPLTSGAAESRAAAQHFQTQSGSLGPAFMGKAMGLRTALASGSDTEIGQLLQECFGLTGAALATALATLKATQPARPS